MNKILESDEILVFDFDYNEDLLLLEYEKSIVDAVFYEDYKTPPLDYWKVVREIEFPFIEELKQMFNIDGRARFYNLSANSSIPMHIDRETLCSINIILDAEKPAPVKYGSGNKYFYKVALLNTSVMHAVDNNDEERFLFKFSIFDEDFETVKMKINEVIDRQS